MGKHNELFTNLYFGRRYVPAWILGWGFRWKGDFKVTHEEAIKAALALTRYCAERFSGDERNCTDCVFQRKETHRCIMKYYIGDGGADMRQWAYPIVQDNYKMLKNKLENTSETRQNQHERKQECN